MILLARKLTIKKGFHILGTILSRSWEIALVAGLTLTMLGCRPSSSVTPFPSERIEQSIKLEGDRFFLIDDGNAYREVDPGVSWEYHTTVFNPEEIRTAYVEENGEIFRVAPDTGKRFKVLRDFSESFEDQGFGIPGLIQLLKEERQKWGSVTLQSPRAPSVGDYVELRRRIVEEHNDFLDARVEPTTSKSRNGQASLKCFAPPRTDAMITCKSSISSPLLYFKNGDHFWFKGYYWIEDHYPMTIADLECEFTAEHSGIRVRIYEDGALGVELKALAKPQFRQLQGSEVRFPKQQWVCVRVHFELSPDEGAIEVWQDDQQVLKTFGCTLPFRSAIYNSLELGISAHSSTQHECTLFVDDVTISSNPL